MPPWTPGDIETAKKYQEAIDAGKPAEFAARYAVGLEPFLETPTAELDIVGGNIVSGKTREELEAKREPVLAKQAMEAGGGTVGGMMSQALPTAAAAGQQVEDIKVAFGGLPPMRPISQVVGQPPPPAQPGAQPPAQPGAQPAGQGFRVAGAGPIGQLGKIAGQMESLSGEQRTRGEQALAPYTPPEQQGGEIPGLPGVSAALDRASLLEELQTLEKKPQKSIAELGRMAEIGQELSALTQQEKAQRETEVREAGAKQLKELEMKQAHQEVLRKTRIEEETQKLNEAIEDVKDWHLAPGRLWRENWGQALGAVVLGALAQTWQQQHGQPGAVNKGLQGVMQAVERDIEAQKLDYQKRKGLVGEQRGAYADMMARFKDERVADEAARISLLQTVDRHLLDLQVRYKGTEIGDMARVQRAAIQGETNTRLMNFQAAVDANTMQSLGAQAGIAGTRASLSMQYQARQDALAAQAAKAAQEGKGEKLKDQEVKEIARLINALDQVSSMHGEFDKHVQSRVAGGYLPDALSRVNREWDDYRALMAQQLGAAFSPTGTVQARMFDKYKEMIPHEDDSEGRGHRQVDALQKQLFTELKSKIQTYAETGKAIPPEWIQYIQGRK